MSEVKNVFQVNDTDESLRSKSGGSFGLNHGFVTALEFNPNAGKDGTPANAVDINVQIGDREYRRRIYEVTGQLYGSNNNLVQPGEEGYQDLFFERMGQGIAVIKHALKAVGVTQEQIDAVTAKLDVNNIAAGMKSLAELAPADYKSKPVDVFLEYQWEIADGQDRTYLHLPSNMKGGYFLIPTQKPVGSWKEVRNDNTLVYVDDADNNHPFDRNSNFMESNKANQQGVGANNAQATVAGATPAW